MTASQFIHDVTADLSSVLSFLLAERAYEARSDHGYDPAADDDAIDQLAATYERRQRITDWCENAATFLATVSLVTVILTILFLPILNLYFGV